MKKRLRWKREPRITGLAAVCANPRGSEYTDGEKTYARTVSFGYRDLRKRTGWWWYASGDGVPRKSTCDEPIPTEEEAKALAAAYVKSFLV